jgi:hypothetical protein
MPTPPAVFRARPARVRANWQVPPIMLSTERELPSKPMPQLLVVRIHLEFEILRVGRY